MSNHSVQRIGLYPNLSIVPPVRPQQKESTEPTTRPQPLAVTDTSIRTIPFPQRINTRYKCLFSEHDDIHGLLTKIEDVWEKGLLFINKDDPNSTFYNDYLDDISLVVKQNEDYFKQLDTLAGTKNSFQNEFQKLRNRPNVSKLQRAVLLTATLEMALLGIPQTPVLANINNGKISKNDAAQLESEKKKETKPNGKKLGGYPQELLAGWFLAKFIYQISPSVDNTTHFKHSPLLPVKKRSKAKENNHYETVSKEIDILAQNFLVSVRSYKTDFTAQLTNLFFIVIDDKNLGLKDNIKKLILVKCADNSQQFSPDFQDKNEHKRHIKQIIFDARQAITNYGSLSSDNEAILDKLISPGGVEVYYIPALDNIDDLKLWIRQRHKLNQS